MFNEVRWLLTLSALTSLKNLDAGLSLSNKEDVLRILGFTSDYDEIDSYRSQCLENGSNEKIKIDELPSAICELDKWFKVWPKRIRQRLIPLIYWASCFVDHPEIKEAFQSKEWNDCVYSYLMGSKLIERRS
jgi:hypothetical protein